MKPTAKLRWLLAYWISRLGVAAGRVLPTRFWYALAGPVADLCYLALRRYREPLEANLRRVVGEKEAPAAARRAFRNFARYVIDFYQLPYVGRDALRERIEFHDWRHLNEALAEGNGVLFVTLHLGQAELGAAGLAAYGHPVSAIAEELPYAPMNDFIQGLRRNLGLKIIAAKKAKPGPSTGLRTGPSTDLRSGVLRCLSRGEVLGMMFDAVGPGEGLRVDFFGAPAEVSGAPARIALRTGARVLPGVMRRDRSDPTRLVPEIDFGLRFEPTGDENADVQALSQAIAASLEGAVRRFPDQWFAFRPAWGTSVPAKAAAPASARDDEHWKQWALMVAVRLGHVLPRGATYGLARLAGDVSFHLRTRARRDVEDNMRHVMGAEAPAEAVSAAAREAFRNVARYYIDLIRLPQTKPAQLLASVRIEGLERVKSRLDAGQGVVVATAHYGNPEAAAQVGPVLGLNMMVLAEPLQPPAFARLMRQLRSAYGPRYVDVGFGAVAAALRHLRAGGGLAIACDRDIQHKGAPVPFFGVETDMPLGAVELAARTGATLIPAYCRRRGDGFDIVFEEPVELVNTGHAKADALVNARSLLDRVEPWLRADPGQWMVLQRIWPASAGASSPRAKADKRRRAPAGAAE